MTKIINRVAKLIGEKSQGMTAVEVYEDDTLVYSNSWFKNGALNTDYIEGLTQAANIILHCGELTIYEKGEVDENEEPIKMNNSPTTGIMLEYNSITKEFSNIDRSYGQSEEIIDALMYLGLIPKDEEYHLFTLNFKNIHTPVFFKVFLRLQDII
jgi:hypothetical protein